LGRCWSTYQDCTFDHVDFGLRGGGFDLGEALDPCNRYGGQVWQESVKGLLVTWPG